MTLLTATGGRVYDLDTLTGRYGFAKDILEQIDDGRSRNALRLLNRAETPAGGPPPGRICHNPDPYHSCPSGCAWDSPREQPTARPEG